MVGLAAIYKRQTSRTDIGDAIAIVLDEADVATARTLALELFVNNLLSDDWKTIMPRRGIKTNFRKLEGAELEELRYLDPRPAPGKPPRTDLTQTIPPKAN